MRAGALRHRVKIESVDDLPRTSFGSPARAWSTFAERWGSVVPLKGLELKDARLLYATVDHVIVLRQLDGVTPKMRVVFKGRIFDILGALNPEERNVETHLMCKEAM